MRKNFTLRGDFSPEKTLRFGGPTNIHPYEAPIAASITYRGTTSVAERVSDQPDSRIYNMPLVSGCEYGDAVIYGGHQLTDTNFYVSDEEVGNEYSNGAGHYVFGLELTPGIHATTGIHIDVQNTNRPTYFWAHAFDGTSGVPKQVSIIGSVNDDFTARDNWSTPGHPLEVELTCYASGSIRVDYVNRQSDYDFVWNRPSGELLYFDQAAYDGGDFSHIQRRLATAVYQVNEVGPNANVVWTHTDSGTLPYGYTNKITSVILTPSG